MEMFWLLTDFLDVITLMGHIMVSLSFHLTAFSHNNCFVFSNPFNHMLSESFEDTIISVLKILGF